jgi:hypothetical protein
MHTEFLVEKCEREFLEDQCMGRNNKTDPKEIVWEVVGWIHLAWDRDQWRTQ